MNIQSIQKHYDKLTTRERFALLTAAIYRGDEADRAALVSSSPRKTWSIPTTHGIVEAFNFLAMWHVMTMQELDSLYWLLLAIGDDETKLSDDNTWLDMMGDIQRRGLSRDSAWRTVCNEYSVDPDKQIADYPGAVSIGFFVDAMKEYSEHNPVDVDPAEYINDLRAVIEIKRKEWE